MNQWVEQKPVRIHCKPSPLLFFPQRIYEHHENQKLDRKILVTKFIYTLILVDASALGYINQETPTILENGRRIMMDVYMGLVRFLASPVNIIK